MSTSSSAQSVVPPLDHQQQQSSYYTTRLLQRRGNSANQLLTNSSVSTSTSTSSTSTSATTAIPTKQQRIEQFSCNMQKRSILDITPGMIHELWLLLFGLAWLCENIQQFFGGFFLRLLPFFLDMSVANDSFCLLYRMDG